MLPPKIDVAESKDAIEVTAELLGVDEKDVDISLADDVLTIRGDKKTEREEQDKDKNWHVVERSYGSFSRAIPLPFDPDATKSRRSLIRACCASACQSRRNRRRSSKRSKSRRTKAPNICHPCAIKTTIIADARLTS
jgi:hypothetical protein